MADWTQYGIFVVALLIGGGFAFGGIASYAGITGGGGGSSQEEFNASLPSKNFRTGGLGMDVREVNALVRYHDVVFVNAYYETDQQRQELQQLRQVSQKFGDRVYVSLVNSSEGSDLMIQYGIAEFPSVLVLGARGTAQPENVTVSTVSDAVCNSFRSLQGGGVSAKCL
ncbi:MAG: hypothetical protein ABEJ56_01330 [Candidatus Nanohaloarchaea archaeon]